MFEITGRQYKALAEIAKAGKKSQFAQLANSVALIDGQLLFSDSHMLVCIEDDSLTSMSNVVYGNCMSEKVKVADRVQFLGDGDLKVGDKEGRVWNDVACEMVGMSSDSTSNMLYRTCSNLIEKQKFTSDASLIAIDPKQLGIISQIFCDFGLRMGVEILEGNKTTTGECCPVPVYKFYSYKEVSQGKQPGFHITAFIMGLNECI